MPQDVNQREKIGLIGLGLIGTAIAQLLLEAGYPVVGFDVDRERLIHAGNLGVQSASSPAILAAQVTRLILSLPDTSIVLEVVEGSDGILHADSLPALIIDTTTGDPEQTAELSHRLKQRNIVLLDATISGSSKQLKDGQAVLMVGGDLGAFTKCKDLLDVLSPKVFYLGPSGSGSRAKLASNLILGLNRLALAEGLVFAEKLGLDLHTFLEVLKVSPAYSAAMDAKGPKMLSGDFAPQSRIRQHRKDVSLILKYAEKAGQQLLLSKIHLDILDAAIEAGDADMDNAAVIREIRRRTKRTNSSDI